MKRGPPGEAWADGTRQCPACRASVPADAKVCAACRFELWAFDENLERGRHLKMEKIPRGNLSPAEFLRERYAVEGGGRAGAWAWWYVLLEAGFWLTIACLFLWPLLLVAVPLFLFLVAACIVVSLAQLLFPGHTHYFLQATADIETHRRRLREAEESIDHCFRGLRCLSCGYVQNGESVWAGPRGEWKCPDCRTWHEREEDYLFLLPHPDAVPGAKMVEYFVNGRR